MLARRGYLPALGRARGVRLAAVADPVAARCEELAPGLPRYASAAELVAAGGVDGLVLATPVAAHLDDARIAAAAGLATLVEKPPAADGAEATGLAELDPLPWLGFNLRFDGDLRRLRAKVPAGARLELALDLHNPAGSWRAHVVEDDALLRLGPHLLDLARWVTGGEIERIRSVSLTPTAAVLDLELERGRARISVGTDRPPATRVEIHDGHGALVVAHTGAGLARRVYRRVAEGDSLVRRLALQLESFADGAGGRPQPVLATALDGIPVMRAIDAARLSAATGGNWIEIRSRVA